MHNHGALSSQLVISLKLAEWAVFPFLALTFGNVHCLLLTGSSRFQSMCPCSLGRVRAITCLATVNANALKLYIILKFNIDNTFAGLKTQEAYKLFTEKSPSPLIYLPSA